MKLSRRDFLKRLALLGSIAPFIDVDKLSKNLPDFTNEQLKELSKVDKVEVSSPNVYMAYQPNWYKVTLKDGNVLYMSKDEILKHYGTVLNFLKIDDNISSIYPARNYPANLND